MRVYNIQNDKIVDSGVNVEKLGWAYDPNKERQLDFRGDVALPWTRVCHSIGDWSIVSALPRLLKEKYKNIGGTKGNDIEIYLPSPEWIRQSMGDYYKRWNFGNYDAADNVNMIFANNPYIDGFFNAGEFDSIICDHHRCYRYENEPLVEKIIRSLGFSEDEIYNANTQPELYFSEAEKEIGDAIIKKYVGDNKFGALVLASRVVTYNKEWPIENDRHLLEDILVYKDLPVFYFSTFDIKDTRWYDIFPNYINFQDIPQATLRIQLYIKSRATFNSGYQAGVQDAVGRGLNRDTKNLLASPYVTMTDNVVRGSTYYFKDGSKTIYR